MYDVIIIGGGPAGLTAGMYACRSGLETVLYEAMFPGGQLAKATSLENVPGFSEGISGPDFAMQLEQQATRFGLKIEYDAVNEIDVTSDVKKVMTSAGKTEESKALIICSGLSQGKLMVDGEDRLTGRGVSTCATCDGALFKGRVTVVVGAGNTAVNDVLYLAPLCPKVYLVHRGGAVQAKPELLSAMAALDNVETVPESVVAGLVGEDSLQAVRVRGISGGEERTIEAEGLFVAVGSFPNTGFLAGKVALSEKGAVITDEYMRTNVPGVMAAGDVRDKPLRQVVTAASDGAIAANSAKQYISQKR
ncbi:MAG: FAD-dependent oxidoreductase [Clostridiales bacterium]|jgi:thioredoxin reductase (NADPH)|nr:FAD-dependent oxidoreductase [Clostridiales bacterium]